MSDEIRAVLKEHGRLSVDAATVGEGHDLYAAGMTSQASVNVMLALERRSTSSSLTGCSSEASSGPSRRFAMP